MIRIEVPTRFYFDNISPESNLYILRYIFQIAAEEVKIHKILLVWKCELSKKGRIIAESWIIQIPSI